MTENKHQLTAAWFAASDFMMKPPLISGTTAIYRRDDERELI